MPNPFNQGDHEDANRDRVIVPEVPDERGGWTSASSAESDSLCPGRHLFSKNIPEETRSADADSGTKIHAWLEGQPDVKLSDDEMQTATLCSDLQKSLVNKFFGDEKLNFFKELRIWATFDGLKHSGKADLVVVGDKFALILDYKTGRNEATIPAKNLQLRDLAALLCIEIGINNVKVAVVQPWATMNPEVCEYDEPSLKQAADEMKNRVRASNDISSKKIPGAKQCQYCRARGFCPAFASASLPAPLETLAPETIAIGIKGLSNGKLGSFLGLVRLAEKAAELEVRARLAAGEVLQDWELKPGRETEKITNATEVFNRALAAGISQEEFVSNCVTVGKTALKSAIKTATGAKGRALDDALDGILEGCTTTKTSAEILTQI